MSEKEQRDQILNTIANFELKVKTLQDTIAHLRKAVERLDSGNITLADLKQEAVRVSTEGMVTTLNNRPSYFDQIAAFFVKIGNSPKTIKEIADGTNITKNSVNNVLYTTHKKLFTNLSIPNYKHRLAWKLTQEAIEKFSIPVAG